MFRASKYATNNSRMHVLSEALPPWTSFRFASSSNRSWPLRSTCGARLCQATFAEETALIQNADCGFFADFRYNGEFYFSFLYIKTALDGHLNKDRLLLGKKAAIFLPPSMVERKVWGIEFDGFLRRYHERHNWPPFKSFLMRSRRLSMRKKESMRNKGEDSAKFAGKSAIPPAEIMISPLVSRVKHAANRVPGPSDFHRLPLASAVWHDVPVPNETISERLRRESDELLETAAKLIEHAATLKARGRIAEANIAARKQHQTEESLANQY
jgi:hypothetical protein